MTTFSDLLREHGASSFRNFSQGKGLKSNWSILAPESQKGICGGLSLAFLGLERLGLSGGMDAEATKYDAALFQYAERLAQYGGSSTDAAQLENAAKAGCSLNRASARLLCGADTSLVGKYCVKSPAGLSMVGMDKHYCASSIKQGAYVFFDPNFGFGTFADSLKFVLFVQAFLKIKYEKPYDVTWFK